MKKVVILFIIFLCLEFFGGILGNSRLKIGFVGDVMLGRLVNEKLRDSRFVSLFGEKALMLLKENDLNVANLESVFTTSDDAVLKAFNFKSDPKNVDVLREGNLNFVNLANNHVLDFGFGGLRDTLNALDAAGVRYFGAGRNLKEAGAPVIVKLKGVKIGILGFTDNEPTWQSTESRPGTNYFRVGDAEDIKRIKRSIGELKPKVDLIIVSMHWGPNMREEPSADFIDFAHDIIDAGGHIIHGHSSHVFQGFERYKNGLILYDTGDFLDDYMINSELKNNLSFLFNVEILDGRIGQLDFIPVKIDNMRVEVVDDKGLALKIKKMLENRTAKIRWPRASR